MTDWLEQYSTALDIRDAREQVHKDVIDAYTRLADRAAARHSDIGSRGTTTAIPTAVPAAPPTELSSPRSDPLSTLLTAAVARASLSSPRSRPVDVANDPGPSSGAPDTLSALRADLGATQRARGVLQAEVAALTATITALQQGAERQETQLAQLARQKTEVDRKLRDRNEELQTKAQLAERVQDEMVSLSLQLNIAEQRRETLERENKELVERWMKRMGAEAEEVNKRSGWH